MAKATKVASIHQTTGGVVLDDDGHKAEAERQKKAAEQTLKAQKEAEEGLINPHVDSVLTTDHHVGKIEPEPDKTRKMEAVKTDQVERTGVEEVTTRPRTTEGKGTTDEVVTSPPTAVTTGLSVPIKSEAQKASDAIKGTKPEASKVKKPASTQKPQPTLKKKR